jgi:hypothetical protein
MQIGPVHLDTLMIQQLLVERSRPQRLAGVALQVPPLYDAHVHPHGMLLLDLRMSLPVEISYGAKA